MIQRAGIGITEIHTDLVGGSGDQPEEAPSQSGGADAGKGKTRAVRSAAVNPILHLGGQIPLRVIGRINGHRDPQGVEVPIKIQGGRGLDSCGSKQQISKDYKMPAPKCSLE